MKKNIFLPSFISLIVVSAYFDISAAKIKINNTTPYAITLAIKTVGLAFATDLPRVIFLAPEETFEFDAGFGGIQDITAFMCGVVSQFVLDIQGTSGLQNISFTTVSDRLALAIIPQNKKSNEAQKAPDLGAVIKHTRLLCPCISNPKP